jgi:hypothetical protein
MPYSQEELEANEHYTSLKVRDEIKYNQEYVFSRDKWIARGGEAHDSFRNEDDVIQLYEDPETGESFPTPNQQLRIWLYQIRYRTNAATKDILDREFKEF